jgi:hypothetical protein
MHDARQSSPLEQTETTAAPSSMGPGGKGSFIRQAPGAERTGPTEDFSTYKVGWDQGALPRHIGGSFFGASGNFSRVPGLRPKSSTLSASGGRSKSPHHPATLPEGEVLGLVRAAATISITASSSSSSSNASTSTSTAASSAARPSTSPARRTSQPAGQPECAAPSYMAFEASVSHHAAKVATHPPGDLQSYKVKWDPQEISLANKSTSPGMYSASSGIHSASAESLEIDEEELTRDPQLVDRLANSAATFAKGRKDAATSPIKASE